MITRQKAKELEQKRKNHFEDLRNIRNRRRHREEDDPASRAIFILDASVSKKNPKFFAFVAEGDDYVFPHVTVPEVKAMLKTAFSDGQLCGKPTGDCFVIQDSFFHAVLQTGTIFLVATNAGVVRSFVIARRLDGNVFYVDLLCARTRVDRPSPDTGTSLLYSGRTLMTLAVDYAKAQGFSALRMSAIEKAMFTYAGWKIGFQFRGSCRAADRAIPVPKTLRKLYDPGCKEGVTRREAIFLKENKGHMEFIRRLRQEGLEEPHKDPEVEAACKSKTLSDREIERRGCIVDGYTMMRCGLQKAREPTVTAKNFGLSLKARFKLVQQPEAR